MITIGINAPPQSHRCLLFFDKRELVIGKICNHRSSVTSGEWAVGELVLERFGELYALGLPWNFHTVVPTGIAGRNPLAVHTEADAPRSMIYNGIAE